MDVLPPWFTNLFSIMLGLVVGSFLNVVIVRLPRSESIIRPRSACPHCHKLIRWWENIPILSFILLGGKCHDCKKPISIRYPIIEALTALLFVTAKIRFGWTLSLVIRDWPFMALIISIAFIDLEHRIIPDILSVGGLILGICISLIFPDLGILKAASGAALGFGSFYFLAWAYQRYTGRMGLGGGDVKLLAMLGAFIGPEGVLATILIGSVSGSVVGVVWALTLQRKNVMKFSIPFGPFLIVGALYYYLLGDILWFRYMIPT